MKDLQAVKYYSAMEAANKVVSQWLEAKPDNKELNAVADALLQSVFYTNQLEMDYKSVGYAVKDAKRISNQLRAELDKKPSEAEVKFMQMTDGDENDAINAVL